MIKPHPSLSRKRPGRILVEKNTTPGFSNVPKTPGNSQNPGKYHAFVSRSSSIPKSREKQNQEHNKIASRRVNSPSVDQKKQFFEFQIMKIGRIRDKYTTMLDAAIPSIRMYAMPVKP